MLFAPDFFEAVTCLTFARVLATFSFPADGLAALDLLPGFAVRPAAAEA